MRIILASTSPRRKQLLSAAGLQFEAVASDYEEDMSLALSPKALAMHLSHGKAASVAKHHRHAVVIGADTFIVFKGELLGKPHTEEAARDMLRRMNGALHSVITGFTIIETDSSRTVSKAVETKVHMRRLTQEEISAYVRTNEPLDKAGAYAIQGLGASIVEKIDGDYANVVGLPVDAVLKELAKFGVHTPRVRKKIS